MYSPRDLPPSPFPYIKPINGSTHSITLSFPGVLGSIGKKIRQYVEEVSGYIQYIGATTWIVFVGLDTENAESKRS